MESLVVLTNTTMSGSSRQPIASNALGALFGFMNYGVASGIVGVVGICTNIANIATFIRLGFKDTINISLIALAITDFANLLCLLVVSVCFTRMLCELLCDVINFEGIAYIVGGVPRSFFVCVSGCITSMVAFERSLCVLKPLQVKTLFSRRKIACVLLGIFVVVSISYIPLFYAINVGWAHNPATNRTWITLIRRQLSFEINAMGFRAIVFLYIVTYLVVALCTFTIVWKLSSQSAWREGKTREGSRMAAKKGVNSEQDQATNKRGLSSKDGRAMRTVILIAIIYIVCYFPGAALLLTMSIVPEFNKGMLYKNLYQMCWSSAFALEGICSSANIVVYLHTSTKFKKAFLSFFKFNAAKPRLERK